jgi:hypothetical protein
LTQNGRNELRHILSQILTMFLRVAEDQHRGKAVAVAELSSLVQPFLTSPAIAVMIGEHYGRLLGVAEDDIMRAKRGDPFQRLMAHPFSEAFAVGELSRDMLPGYFSFLHLVLGEARATMGEACVEIFDELKEQPFFMWDDFYEDPRSLAIQWEVIARVADNFRRFDARREWFISLMANRPQAHSLGVNAFLPNSHHRAADEVYHFGAIEFNVLFRCLFSPLLIMSEENREAFKRQFAASPEQKFQLILKNIGVEPSP